MIPLKIFSRHRSPDGPGEWFLMCLPVSLVECICVVRLVGSIALHCWGQNFSRCKRAKSAKIFAHRKWNEFPKHSATSIRPPTFSPMRWWELWPPPPNMRSLVLLANWNTFSCIAPAFFIIIATSVDDSQRLLRLQRNFGSGCWVMQISAVATSKKNHGNSFDLINVNCFSSFFTP